MSTPPAGDPLNGLTRITFDIGSMVEGLACRISRCSALTTRPLAPLGDPPWVHQRDLTATVTAHDVTWQT